MRVEYEKILYFGVSAELKEHQSQLTKKCEMAILNSVMQEDFAGSTLGVSATFSSSSVAVSSDNKGELSEVDHSFGEVGDLGGSDEPELLNCADMLSCWSRVSLELELHYVETSSNSYPFYPGVKSPPPL